MTYVQYACSPPWIQVLDPWGIFVLPDYDMRGRTSFSGSVGVRSICQFLP